MSFQWLIATLIVIACSLFSSWRLLAVRYRLSLLDRAAAVCPALRGHSRIFARLHANALAQLAKGCGACAARAPAVKRT